MPTHHQLMIADLAVQSSSCLAAEPPTTTSCMFACPVNVVRACQVSRTSLPSLPRSCCCVQQRKLLVPRACPTAAACPPTTALRSLVPGSSTLGTGKDMRGMQCHTQSALGAPQRCGGGRPLARVPAFGSCSRRGPMQVSAGGRGDDVQLHARFAQRAGAEPPLLWVLTMTINHQSRVLV